jgi:uncharacterized protein YecT (DUF1311 family)
MLRTVRTQWLEKVGDGHIDQVNQEILKLTMRGGKVEDKDINAAYQKLLQKTNYVEAAKAHEQAPS